MFWAATKAMEARGFKGYERCTASLGGGLVRSAEGLEVQTTKLAAFRPASVDTLVVSGTETDVCVLGTVLGAVDRGYRVVIATDAVCSSSDETHDALLTLYGKRYGQQVETATVDVILKDWA